MSMLSIGTSGLNAAQVALNVASNNIANVNTPGYSRQEVLLGSRFAYGGLDNGIGVGVTGVRRIADNYLNTQLWSSGSATGFYRTQSQYLNTTEKMFGSDALSITKGLDGLFAAFSAALESPESLAPRQQIISSAQSLANRFNQLSLNLSNQEKQLSDEMTSTIGEVNRYSSQVAALNKQIGELAAGGGNTSQLEDQRDEAIKALSGLVDVQVNRQADGSVNLSLSQGQPLVLGNSAGTLMLTNQSLAVQMGTQKFPVEQTLRGSLGGLIDVRDNVLQPSRSELNDMALKLAQQINEQQGKGVDINDPRTLGKPLFTFDASDPAATLKISADFKAQDLAFGAAKLDASGNPILDAAGHPVPEAGIGDNSNLQAIIDLKENHYDAYGTLLGKLAVQSGQAQAEYASSQKLQTEVQNKVNSVSGVNLDEEGVNIMQFAQAYQANAKVISTADQLFTTVLGMF